MKGYKVFNPDWTCRNFQYSVGETYEENVKPLCCKKGFHFCTELKDCFNYYFFDPDNKVAEIEALGDIDTEITGNKHCTNKIKIIRELSWEDVLKMLNTGKANTGRYNTGDYNHGDYNSGNYNSGNCNTGCYNSGRLNTGHYNSGNRNVGHYNSGCENTGNFNIGHWNTGDYNGGNHNSGDYNTGSYNNGDCNNTNFSNGCFNTKSSKIFMFNKLSNWTIEDWRRSEAKELLDNIRYNSFQRIQPKEEEKDEELYPEYEIADDYPKEFIKSEYNLWWNNLSDHEKDVIKSLPNFDAEIFKEITGININKGSSN